MQQSIPYAPATAGALCWQRLHHLLKVIAARVGQKVIAAELRITEGVVSSVLDPEKAKKRKKNTTRLAAEWLPVLLHLANYEERAAFLSVFAGDVGFVVERRRPLTPEEELAKMREHFEREAPGVLRGFDREVSR